MSRRIYRSYKELNREGLSWDERWKGHDKGLITCWEVGRELGNKNPEIAKQAKNGELPATGWKGGVEKNLKLKIKYGTLFYLAEWQGLRGEDLDVDLDKEIEIVCSKTKQRVIFTPDQEKYSNA